MINLLFWTSFLQQYTFNEANFLINQGDYQQFISQMMNPFEQQSSCNTSMQDFDSSLPICFQAGQREDELHLSTPIATIDLDRLSQKAIDPEAGQQELRHGLQQAQQMLREIKTYTESLENRNLQVVIELERERMKNKQLLSALNFVRASEEERNKVLETRMGENQDLASRNVIDRNKVEVLENEAKTLRLENNYLKQLILIANQNYQKLENKNRELVQRCSELQEQRNRREIQMLKKTEEIKSVFAAIVVDRHQHQPERQQRKEDLINTNNSITLNTLKSVKKQPVEDAYRQIFMRTLKPKNQNRP